MSLNTPDTIRTLQRKLYAKAKQAHADVADSSTEFGGSTHSVALDQHETRDCACLGVKNIGKPCAGKSHARFDEGGQAKACSLLYLWIAVFGPSCDLLTVLPSNATTPLAAPTMRSIHRRKQDSNVAASKTRNT